MLNFSSSKTVKLPRTKSSHFTGLCWFVSNTLRKQNTKMLMSSARARLTGIAQNKLYIEYRALLCCVVWTFFCTALSGCSRSARREKACERNCMWNFYRILNFVSIPILAGWLMQNKLDSHFVVQNIFNFTLIANSSDLCVFCCCFFFIKLLTLLLCWSLCLTHRAKAYRREIRI